MNDPGSEAATLFEALIGGAVLIGIVVAIGDTPLYPIAFGVVFLVFMRLLLNHPRVLPGIVQWAASKTQATSNG